MIKYASHMPVLKQIFLLTEIKTVIEFGMGHFSTDFFLKNAEHVTSIEMQNGQWYQVLHQKFKFYKNWLPISAVGPNACFDLVSGEKVDLCFVDGHQLTRPECVNMQLSDIIVAHDTESALYRWDRVNLPAKYKSFRHSLHGVETTVYSTDHSLINGLCKGLN